MKQLADRFEAVKQKTGQAEKTAELNQMSYAQLSQMTIKLGEAKIGKTYGEVLQNDPRYCQGFLKKYAESEKPEHMEFAHFLALYVERQELMMEKAEPDHPKMPRAKAKAKSAAMPSFTEGSMMGSVIDLEEDDLWEALTENQKSQQAEIHNSQRLDQLEGALSQLMGQIQQLTCQVSIMASRERPAP